MFNPLIHNQPHQRLRAYEDSLEHLQDELRRLDLKLHIRLLSEQNHGYKENPLDTFKGVVLNDTELMHLLQPEDSHESPPASMIQDERPYDFLLEELKLQELLISERRQASLDAGVYLALPWLSSVFGLTQLEEQCLMICAAPDMDNKYEQLYSAMQKNRSLRKPSIDLATRLLCETFRERMAFKSLLEWKSHLVENGLIQLVSEESAHISGLGSKFMQADPRIVGFLLGSRLPDRRITPFTRKFEPEEIADESGYGEAPLLLSRKIIDFVEQQRTFGSDPVAVYVQGPRGSGKQMVARRVSKHLGLPLLMANAAALPHTQHEVDAALFSLFRESRLQEGILCFYHVEALFAGEDSVDSSRVLTKLIGYAERFPNVLLLLLGTSPWQRQIRFGEQRGFYELEIPPLLEDERISIWQQYAPSHCIDEDTLQSVAEKYRFTPGQIREVLAEACLSAQWRCGSKDAITREDLEKACRKQLHHRLHLLADSITPSSGWEDLILPQDQRTRLEEVVQHARYKEFVYRTWGFERKLARGKGLNILFHGPPGTGKTTAAEVLAGELRQDLFRIDLSQVVSKYIGETEKNLQKVFEEARDSYAILFFDEADALFSKRTEVKDSLDRHANTEVAYLLQKMEEYDGITILATNLQGNLDEAFIRRMRFCIEFPLPDEATRLRIWESMFPKEAELGPDIDLPFLSQTFKLAGGNIKNIVLSAAFMAAAAGSSIGMKQLVQATRRELEKIGKLIRKDEFGSYAHYL